MKHTLLGDIAIISSGGTPDRSTPEYWGGRIPWVKTGEIHFNTIRDAEEKITDLALEESSAKLVPAGSLLMAMYGQGKTRGQVALLGIEAAINQACAAITPHDFADSRYLFQYLAANYANVRHLSNSGSQENLNAELIRGIRLFYPDKPQRQKIADILGKWDEALEKLDALIAAKDRRKKALMQQLLTGQRRLPGAKAWKRVLLADVAEECGERNRETLDRRRLFAVTKAAGMVPMRENVQGATINRCKLVEPGWFAYNPMRINIGSIARWEGTAPVMVSPDYVVFRAKEDRLLSDYLNHVRQAAPWADFVGASGNGSVRVRIWFDDLGRFKFPLPSLTEQTAIADILDTADTELRLLRRQRAALDRQKRGLMQQLLTGKVRVKP